MKEEIVVGITVCHQRNSEHQISKWIINRRNLNAATPHDSPVVAENAWWRKGSVEPNM